MFWLQIIGAVILVGSFIWHHYLTRAEMPTSAWVFFVTLSFWGCLAGLGLVASPGMITWIPGMIVAILGLILCAVSHPVQTVEMMNGKEGLTVGFALRWGGIALFAVGMLVNELIFTQRVR